MKTWEEVAARRPLMLNLGGDRDCHPAADYENYVSVDLEPRGDWSVKHDVTEPFPLPDGSVDRVLSEHLFEHIALDDLQDLLVECHRLLKEGGFLRVAVPDYQSPKELKYLKRGHDPRHTDHLTFFTFDIMRELAEKSPFRDYRIYHYWNDGRFHYEPIDYSLGMIKRTPDNDRRSRRDGLAAHAVGFLRDAAFVLSRGFVVSRTLMSVQRGHRLRVTSLVVDLFKQ